METEEIGSCTATIYKLQTMTDGGVRLTLDIGSNENELAQKLLSRKLRNQPVIQLGIVGINHEDW